MTNTSYLSEREEDSFERHCRLSRFLAKSDMCIFDVGANTGQSIEKYREKFQNCVVHSFEPNPETFVQLQKNWGDTPDITLNQIALSDYIGTASFHATRVSELSSLLQPTERIIELSSEHKYDHTTITVPTTSLDNYCQLKNINHIDILKIDVQGFELNVLKGAETLLCNGRITSIYSEATLAETYKNQSSFTDIISFLTSNNYAIWDIGSFLYTRNDRLWAANLLLLHEAAATRVEKDYSLQDRDF